jgi:hypothetical protein
LAGLQSAVESADAAPTKDAVTGFAERKKLVTSTLVRWQELLAKLDAEGLKPAPPK